MRTPIAAALAQTQRLQAELSCADTQERGRHIEGALRTLARLSESLMQLSKAENGRVLTEGELGRLVKPFERGAAARGCGLGLAIVEAIVRGA